MAERKIFAGPRLRRLRRGEGLTQAAMAARLRVSPSYLNLVERNQRPLSAALLVKLLDRFDFDPRALSAAEPGGGEAAIRILETARDPARFNTLTWVPDSIHALRHDLDFHVLSIGNSPWIEIDFPEDLETARRQVWPQLAPATLG